MITCRPGKDDDILKIGKFRDHDEIFIVQQICPRLFASCLWLGSKERMVIEMDGEIIGLYGINGSVPWLLGTDDLPKAAKTLVKIGIKTINKWASEYPNLITYVSHDHKWLEKIGFKIESGKIINGINFKVARL